jgi:quinol monooxygenase YgiN
MAVSKDLPQRLFATNRMPSVRRSHARDGGTAGHFSPYEIYDDSAAFAEHLKADHYRQFDAAVTLFVVAKKVVRLSLVKPNSKP